MRHLTAQTLSAEVVRPLVPSVILSCQHSLHRRLTQVALPSTRGGSRYRASAARLPSPTPLDKLRLAAFKDAPTDLRTDVEIAARPIMPSVQAFVYPLLAERLTDRTSGPGVQVCRDGHRYTATPEQALDAVSDLFLQPLLLGLTVLSFDAALGPFERFLLAFALNDSRGSYQQHLYDQRIHLLPEEHLDHLSILAPDTGPPVGDAEGLNETVTRLGEHFQADALQADSSLHSWQAERLYETYISVLEHHPEALQIRDRRGNPHLPHGTARLLPTRCSVTVAQERRAREVFFLCLVALRNAVRSRTSD